MPDITETQMSPEMQQCLDSCIRCHDICLETVNYCLKKGGKYAECAHIILLLDCAEICQTSANFMARGSELHRYVCGICAEVCDRCAQSCEQMGDDKQMKTCAMTCHRCAESCRKMAA